MENKYYQPEIEEFHVGFEYESFETPLSPSFAFESKPAEWVKRKVLDINNSEYKDKALYHVSINNRYEENVEWNKNIRVKYLDEQDVLDLGFEYINNKRDLVKDNIRIRTYIGEQFEVPNVCIYCVKNFRIFPKEELLIFKGKIKNKSELKKVLKQIEL